MGFSKAKRMDLVPPFPENCHLPNLCTCRFYLVELCGDILVVVRFIGKFVDWDEKLVREAADCTHPKGTQFITRIINGGNLEFARRLGIISLKRCKRQANF
ncbi:Uncharacterized protein TCM_026916 [Theobroma cacao]|uniref:Uncharacterized protein n=1 Tax=Theobroma cacao TaxID=3641 RepID=A0A061GEP7_THECC|nr:Uncharacterized protein TCM_026916 [Theobroma cacao]